MLQLLWHIREAGQYSWEGVFIPVRIIMAVIIIIIILLLLL
jgi:hypothetical protein